jgi:hypothetical protein
METRPRAAVEDSHAPAATPTVQARSAATHATGEVAPPPAPPNAPPHQSTASREAARAQRTEWVHSAIASGSGRENWTDQGQALVDEIAKRAEHVEDSGCFIQGCTATYTFPSRAAYDTAYRDITDSETYAAWTGGKRWSSPEEQDDGRIIVALILYRPN